jgi:hypothetical protein
MNEGHVLRSNISRRMAGLAPSSIFSPVTFPHTTMDQADMKQ